MKLFVTPSLVYMKPLIMYASISATEEASALW